MDVDRLIMDQTPGANEDCLGLPDSRFCYQSSTIPDLLMEMDTKRKGLCVLVRMDDTWKITALMAPAGICILDSPSYRTILSSIFFQCTNCDKSSVGHTCLGRQSYTDDSRQRQPRFSSLNKPGNIPGCFLAIPQAIVFYSDEPRVVFHRLDEEKIRTTTVSALIAACRSDQLSFVRKLF